MDKKFLISGAVVSVLALALSFLIHAVILDPDYMALAQLYRSPADQTSHMQWMLLAHLLYGFGLTWIFRRGVSPAGPIGQGIRFGLAVTVTFVATGYLVYYVVQPLPGMLVLKQIVLDGIGSCIVGVALAFLNRDTART